jgi:23S rRNA pseudouridine1911/1915/1917 synthase
MTTIHIEAADAGKRLDLLLVEKNPDNSRSRIQNAIKDGAIQLNGKPAKVHAFLKEGDVVTVETGANKAAPEPKKLKGRKDIAFGVVYEDDDLAVIDKPTGLLVHPTVQDETETLAHAIVGRWPEIAKVGDSPERPGIVHRLDKDASGLMVVCKTKKAFTSLKKQFQEHTIEKEYAVLVHGRPSKDSGTVTLTIGRATRGGHMVARPEPLDEEDRPAITHFRVEEFLRDSSLLSVRTETGRTHQIRAHFHALGNSVVGDQLYRFKPATTAHSPRLFLHAKRLAFEHPTTKQRVEFAAPLPADLETALAQLRK